jgi:hypothetical protein
MDLPGNYVWVDEDPSANDAPHDYHGGVKKPKLP